MRIAKPRNVSLSIPQRALEVVFDECDRYDTDETGGRILGTYREYRNGLLITVTGIIEPGPAARRSATSFMQDGAWQERVFRLVEEREPSIEHLGNWHTHHVNGLQHLSTGDIATYRRTVEHQNHNTSFFYALLVVERNQGKTGLQRYHFKNYIFRRGDSEIYEIPVTGLRIVDAPLLWPAAVRPTLTEHVAPDVEFTVRKSRACDQDFLSEFYPKVGTFKSKDLGIYWRGVIQLVDGSELEVVVLEDASREAPDYTITLRNNSATLAESARSLAKKEFSTCRAALVAAERMCNAELYEGRRTKRRRKRWTS